MLGPSLRSTEQDVCEAPFSSLAPREPTPGMFLSMTNSGTRDLHIGFEERRPSHILRPPHSFLVRRHQCPVGPAESQKIERDHSLDRGVHACRMMRQTGSPAVCRPSTTRSRKIRLTGGIPCCTSETVRSGYSSRRAAKLRRACGSAPAST